MGEIADQQLFDAAARGDMEGVQAALAQGADLEARGPADMTALTLATRQGHLAVVRYLLEQGALVTGDTLIVANMSVYSNVWLLKFLQLAQIRQVQPETAHRADAEARLLQAAYQGDVGAARAAIAAGAQVHVCDGQDTAALRWAARGGHLDVVRALLEAGADVNQASYTGWTALMEAVLAESEEVAALLIEKGANVNARTFADASVLYFARDLVESGFSTDREKALRVVALLEAHGAMYQAPRGNDD